MKIQIETLMIIDNKNISTSFHNVECDFSVEFINKKLDTLTKLFFEGKNYAVKHILTGDDNVLAVVALQI